MKYLVTVKIAVPYKNKYLKALFPFFSYFKCEHALIDAEKGRRNLQRFFAQISR